MTARAIEVLASGVAVEAPAMFPAAERTDNAIIVSYSTVPDGWPGGQVGVRRSLDGGQTWEEPMIVGSPAEGEDAVLGAVGLTRISTGELLLPYNPVTWTPGMGTEGRRMSLRLAVSSDEGATWPETRAVKVDFFGPAVYGELVELEDGELLWPVWGQRAEGEKWRSVVLSSRDHGRSWAVKGTIGFDPTAHLEGDYAAHGDTGALEDGIVGIDETADPDFRPHDPTDGFTETSIVRLADGRLLAVLRQQGVDGDQTLLFFRSLSADGGATWSHYESMGFSGMSPALVRLADDSLLLAYRRFAPEDSGITPAVDVRIGSADGLSWAEPVALQDPHGTVLTAEYQCGYPAIVPDGDGRYLIYFYSFEPSSGRYVAWNRIEVPAVGGS